MADKSALVLLAEGAEEMELVISIDVMRRAGIRVTVAGVAGAAPVRCRRETVVVPDASLAEAAAHGTYDAVVLPGGIPGAKNLSAVNTDTRKKYDDCTPGHIEKIHELLFDGCDISSLSVSVPGPSGLVPSLSHTVYNVPEEDCDTAEIFEERQDGSETEQIHADILSEDEEDDGFYVCHKKKDKKSAEVGALLREQEKAGRFVCAICAAPTVLKHHGVAYGKNITSFPPLKDAMMEGNKYNYKEDKVVVDGKLITSRGPGTAFDFALRIVEEMVGKEEALAVAKAMLLA